MTVAPPAKIRSSTSVVVTVLTVVFGLVVLAIALDLIFDPITRAMIKMSFCMFAGCGGLAGQ